MTAARQGGEDGRARFLAGVRDGWPFAAAGGVLALSFGVVATGFGLSGFAAVIMSAVVFAGSAQFAALGIIAAGGGVAAAVGAAALVNSRFLPMGFALGPSLRGGRWRRGLEGQVVVDSSWAMASRGDGTFERLYLFGHTAVQYVTWVLGTAVGALAPGLDQRALGLDAVFPAFFLVLLVGELRDPTRRLPALLGAAVALALVPVTPVGIPILAASAAALVGLRAREATVNAWPVIVLVALVTVAIKGVGPAVMAGRDLPGSVTQVVARLAAALLAALVVVNALTDGRTWHVGADTVGVGVAALLLWLRAPVLVVVLGAALTAALVRRLGLLD